MQHLKDLLEQKVSEYDQRQAGKEQQSFINHEFQDYGMRLAHRMGDLKMKAFYIRAAKTMPRALLEDAAAFADTYNNARNKGKIFSWKLGELLELYREKHPEFKITGKPQRRRKAKTSANPNYQLL